MARTIFDLGVFLVALQLTALAAEAADGEPRKAHKAQATLVNAFEECTAPSEAMDGTLPVPACPAVDSSSGVCDFGPRGTGTVSTRAKYDLSVSLRLSGLVNCPDGTVLQMSSTNRITTNSCTISSRCTTVDLANFPLPGATCAVTNGKCKLKTTINTNVPGFITPFKNTAFGLGRIQIVLGSKAIAMAGVLVP